MENIKFNFIPSQAKSIYQYKSLRTKVLKCNANIMFNKQCLSKNLIPNCVDGCVYIYIYIYIYINKYLIRNPPRNLAHAQLSHS